MKILTLASSPYALFLKEAVIAAQKQDMDIEWGVMITRAPYLGQFDGIVRAENLFYLYERFNDVFARDAGSPHLSKSEDNVNRVLACDKDGYRHESAEFQHRCASAMLEIYGQCLKSFQPDCVLLPPLETVDGILLLAICQEMGITPLYVVHMRNLGESFFSDSLYEKLPAYYGKVAEADRNKARAFIREFLAGRRGAGEMPEAAAGETHVRLSTPPLFLRLLRNTYDRLTRERLHRGEDGFVQRIKTNLIKPLYAVRRLRYRLTQNRIFDVTPTRGTLPNRFVLYAAQVTPESSINTLAQFFIEQDRAIDLLRLSMPHGYSVVVKEHPSMAGSRPRSFYKHLRKLPGVVLASPDMPIRVLMEKADLVATVTGTIGLEAFLLDKPCLMFGRNFFSHLCHRIDKIDGLQSDISELLARHRPKSEEEKVEAIARLYHIAYPFALFDPYYRPEVLSSINIENFLDAICRHLVRLAEVKASAQGRDSVSAIRP